ncbi:MAG: HAMP domain-containing histidine kinase [Anaerolineaceae bacterium]|nr:HAMP domain-containing histidine kinase [Anaerolineaceae bacterium]
MNIPKNLSLRYLIALSSLLLYGLSFIGLYPYAGVTTAALSIIPAAAFGWILGPRGGLLYGLLALFINIGLFRWVGEVENDQLFNHLVGTTIITLASIGIGWVKNINYRTQSQTDALQQEHKLLQEEIERRIQAEAALRQANAELQARNKELDAFAHTVAHDLKNPLGIITSYSELLNGDGVNMHHDELELIFKEVQKSGRKATNIIEELLLLSSIRKEAITMRPLNMAKIVEEAQGRVALMTQAYQAEIICPQQWPQALGYTPWVEEVWVNYLSNGLKYGGEPPRLELGATVQDNGMIRFWVRDNGLGLPIEAQTLLFTEFTRLDEIRTKGNGLGLSIVRRIVEKLGGQVGVESSSVPGQGCTFYFTLAAK